jgi:hypothetical protein
MALPPILMFLYPYPKFAGCDLLTTPPKSFLAAVSEPGTPDRSCRPRRRDTVEGQHRSVLCGIQKHPRCTGCLVCGDSYYVVYRPVLVLDFSIRPTGGDLSGIEERPRSSHSRLHVDSGALLADFGRSLCKRYSTMALRARRDRWCTSYCTML